MNRKRSIYIILSCFFLFFVLTGCWNRKDINTLAIVQAIGVDSTNDGEICLTLQILKPSEARGVPSQKGQGNGGGKGVWTTSITGSTIFEAFKNATAVVDRDIFLSHNRIIVIGEKTAKSGLKPIVDFFNRNFQVRNTVNIFIAKGEAKEILKIENDQENIPSKAIERLAEVSYLASREPQYDLQKFFSTLVSKTNSLFIPGIEATGEISKQLRVDGLAIFKEDKLIGWFNQKETRGLLWVLNEVKNGIIVVPSPNDETKNVSLELIRTKSKVSPEIEGNDLIVNIDVNEEGDIGEVMSEKTTLEKADNLYKLEKEQTKIIEGEIKAAIDKAQDTWGVDIFKFGDLFYRKYPKEWKKLKENWSQEYKNVKVVINVESKLYRIGKINSPE